METREDQIIRFNSKIGPSMIGLDFDVFARIVGETRAVNSTNFRVNNIPAIEVRRVGNGTYYVTTSLKDNIILQCRCVA